MERSKILIIEDNADTRRFLEVMLSKEFEVITAENAVIGIDYARNKAPNLILLDIVMPILSGYDACSLMKQDEKTRQIPIIFTSVKNSVSDVTLGLSYGADDYIPKPFDYKELLSRIHARLRKANEDIIQPLQVGAMRFNPMNREVSYSDKKLTLTITEFGILYSLAAKAGKVVTREDILKEVWRDTSGETNDRTIDVHIRALRKKIPPLTRYIQSIYGVGYKFDA